jgi:AcrR family transcriptional regulator
MELTRGRIIDTAIELIERDGGPPTMAGLAAELGCGLIALYAQVPSRDALLDQVAERVLSGTQRAPTHERGWAERLREQARAQRSAGLAYPQCAAITATRQAWRPRRARPGADDLASLSQAGFGAEDTGRLARALAAYVLGSVLLAAGSGQRQEEVADADFEFGLELLLQATSARLGAGPQTAGRDR